MHHASSSSTAAGIALVFALTTRDARADNWFVGGVARASAYTIANLVPSQVAFDVAPGSTPPPGLRGSLGWSVQLPIGLRDRFPFDRPTYHRVVFDADLVFALQRDPSMRTEALVTGRTRIGYRFVWHPGDGPVGLLAGLGHTIEYVPLIRPSVSLELGIHVGNWHGNRIFDGERWGLPKAWLVAARGDVFFAGDPAVRIALLAGWAFY